MVAQSAGSKDRWQTPSVAGGIPVVVVLHNSHLSLPSPGFRRKSRPLLDNKLYKAEPCSKVPLGVPVFSSHSAWLEAI